MTRHALKILAAASLAAIHAMLNASEHWPLQKHPGPDGDPGQDPKTYPISRAAFGKPAKRAVSDAAGIDLIAGPALLLRSGWRMRSALQVPDTIREISQVGYDDRGWYRATVPGTVLTTLVDEGVYPEPTFGLDNMAIPEALARQDWWYRKEFSVEPESSRSNYTLTFEGVNYAAEVWLNGERVGEMRGAFKRGIFDVTKLIRAKAANALAVRISPPPHPGIPHEESLVAGAGVPNGGSMCFDGPTFFCTEGWDWIPGIRDRCSGIWQDVTLRATGPVAIGDLHIKTELPLPRRDRATLFLSVAVRNLSDEPRSVVVRAAFDGREVEESVTLSPNESGFAKFWSGKHPELVIETPRLWWPNGYGAPELYDLQVFAFDVDGAVSDRKQQRFGIRQVTYELTARDADGGAARRVEFDPSAVWDRRVVDTRHESLRPSAGSWIPTLAPDAFESGGLRASADTDGGPYLKINVNGVPIVCKGGNWGLDEALKRCSREKLEPYFRLQKEANVTMVRNWCGQNTEEAFFELADEYGLMVWSDFWISTQDWNQQPGDLSLFLANAEDTIRRFRNHPSIVIWCGRNEGVPPPALNEGLDQLVRSHDGSRYYQPNSREVNLLPSGPWVYVDPRRFFNELGLGFSTELGLPSPPSLDAYKAMMAPEDLWPISDAWAYHDWHQAHHGEVQSFETAMEESFGAATSLEDFNRKAQMLSYVSHRAMFEGLNARLWKPATGRLMWMSHPAWPSMNWQMYSSDYDTNGAYFGVRKACEPTHVQFNLDDRTVAIANASLRDLAGLRLRTQVFDRFGELNFEETRRVDAPANCTTIASGLDGKLNAEGDLVFLKLELTDAGNEPVSDNLYWLAGDNAGLRALNELPRVALDVETRRLGEGLVMVTVANRSKAPALLVRPVARDSEGNRVLPAFASDGCFSLMPGDRRVFTIESPKLPASGLAIGFDAWNVAMPNVAVADFEDESASLVVPEREPVGEPRS